MDRKFDGWMKVLDEITYKHKYLEKVDVQNQKIATVKVPQPRLSGQGKQLWVSIQASSKWWRFCEGIKGRTSSVECSKHIFELESRHQVSDAVFWEGKDPNLDWVPKKDNHKPSVSIQTFSKLNDVDFCLCIYAKWQKWWRRFKRTVYTFWLSNQLIRGYWRNSGFVWYLDNKSDNKVSGIKGISSVSGKMAY